MVIVIAIAITAGEHHLKGPLAHLLSARTGRNISVDGALTVRLFALHPTITAEQVSIGNPPWMPSGLIANVGKLVLTFEWQRSLHLLGIRRLEIDDANLNLTRDAAGNANWWMHASGPGKGPPLIRSLSMVNAHVDLNDARRHLQFQGTVSAADAGTGSPPLRIAGSGHLNGRPVSFVIDGEPLSGVHRGHPYRFSFDERSGASELAGHGMVMRPFDLRVLQATFAATGPNLKDGYFLVGLGLPNSGPYHLSGKLSREGKLFIYSELAATTGQSDMSGRLAVDSTSGRAVINGELSSRLLRLADLDARAAGLAPEASRHPGLRIPDAPFHLRGMVRVDATVQFRARELAVGPEELRDVATVIAIDRGVLSIEGVKATFADGTISGSARLDASQQPPHGQVNLRVTGLQLDHFKGKKGDPPFTGLLSGRLQLRGKGNSFHELSSNVTGTLTAVVPHGAMRTSLVDAANLDLIGALGARLWGHGYTDVHCVVANLDAHDGTVTARTFLIDTNKVLIYGTGDIQMGSEELDLTLGGRPKNARLALHSAVSIRGTLENPKIGRVGQNVLAAALKVVLKPVAAALTFIDPELPRDPDCSALIAQPRR